MKLFIQNYYSERYNQGFTFFELIAVLLLISILMLIVLNKTTVDNKDLINEADLLKSNIRYVQQLSLLNDQRSLRITFSQDKYTLYSNNSALSFSFPNEDDSTHLIHPNVDIAIKMDGTSVFNLDFDKWGGISNDNDFSVTLTDNRTASFESFYIIQNTGFIP